MQEMLEADPEHFAQRFKEMLDDGDSTAWQLMTKRVWPEPKQELDITSDGGPVSFSWKQPAKPKSTRKKTPRKKKSNG